MNNISDDDYFYVQNCSTASSTVAAGFLQVELICKSFKLSTSSVVDNFYMSINYFKSVKISLAFCMYARSHKNDNNLSTNKRALLHKLDNKETFTVMRQSSDYTNHQKIFFHKYMIYTREDDAYYRNLNNEFDCCVDYNFTSDFDIFLVQNNINIGDSCVFKLNSIFKNNSPFTINSIVKRTSLTTLVKSTIQCVQFTFAAVSLSYEDYCLLFWQLADKTVEFVPMRIGCFDIETGINKKFFEAKSIQLDEKNLPFPNPQTGFVECIVMYKTLLVDKYIETEQTSSLLLWIQDTWGLSYHDYVNCLSEMFSTPCIKVILCKTELELIRHFLIYTSTNIDVLIGYNSKNFDLPFLVLRANILTNENDWFLRSNLDKVYLSVYHENHKTNNLIVRSQKQTRVKFKCQQCSQYSHINNNNYTSATNNNKRTTTSTPFYCKNLKCNNMTPRLLTPLNVSFDEQSSSNNVNNEFVFTLHRDLIRDKRILGLDTVSHRLDDKCNEFFREQCTLIGQQGKSIEIQLNTKLCADQMLTFVKVFNIGIKVMIVRVDKLSGQTYQLVSGRLADINIISSSDDISCKKTKDVFEMCNLIAKIALPCLVRLTLKLDDGCCNIVEDNNWPIYCTIGKTSDQTVCEQILWTNKTAILKTIKYCAFDVMLTFSIERKFQTLFDLFPRKFNRQTSHNLINTPPGVKSTNLLLYALYGKTCLIKSTRMMFKIYLLDALKIECVKAPPDVASQQYNNHIFNIPCNSTLDDFLNLRTKNMNEFALGMNGEYDTSDFVKFHNSVTNLL